VAVEGDSVVAWRAMGDESAHISTWDMTSRNLVHFRSRKSFKDFTVVRHLDQTILLSGVSSLRASGSVTAEQYDSEGQLLSSRTVHCAEDPLRKSCKASTEFSKALFAYHNGITIILANYRLSCTHQSIINTNFEYNVESRILTSPNRYPRFPVTEHDTKDNVKYQRFYGSVAHSPDVLSVAYKQGWYPSSNKGDPIDYYDDRHSFYCWQDDGRLSLAPSEIREVNDAVYDTSVQKERFRYSELKKCFGDETFLVRCYERGIEVYCFDKNHPLANECTSYRRERDRRAKERRKLRKEAAKKLLQE
jgi:hypothetical protein